MYISAVAANGAYRGRRTADPVYYGKGCGDDGQCLTVGVTNQCRDTCIQGISTTSADGTPINFYTRAPARYKNDYAMRNIMAVKAACLSCPKDYTKGQKC